MGRPAGAPRAAEAGGCPAATAGSAPRSGASTARSAPRTWRDARQAVRRQRRKWA